jgi:hypothetical protein
MITIPLPHGHLSTSCAGCTSGCNQYFKELQIKNPTRFGFSRKLSYGISFHKDKNVFSNYQIFFFMKLYLGCSSFQTWTYKYVHIPQRFYKGKNFFSKSQNFPHWDLCLFSSAILKPNQISFNINIIFFII